MNDETTPAKKFQFSLGMLLGAMLYAAALATITVNLVGKNWNPVQTAAGYFITILCVVGFTVVSKARGTIAAYLLLAPLVFVSSVVAASMFKPPVRPTSCWKGPATTTPITTPPATVKYVPQPPPSPGSGVPLSK